MGNMTFEDFARAAEILTKIYEKSKEMLKIIPVNVQKEMLEKGFTIDDFIREYKKYSGDQED